jgi:HlyD family secretion protein
MKIHHVISGLFTAVVIASPSYVQADTVTCLGRLEPLDGVILLAGPSGLSYGGAVISELKVSEGDWVTEGQTLAVLDDYRLRAAEVARHKELVEDATVQLQRLENLSKTQSTSRAKLDEARYKLRALQAEKKVYDARQEMSLIRAPKRAQVLEIFTQPGEKVGEEGVMELGETDNMSVVAEVYETDISKVKVGQKARITSAALSSAVTGTVSHVGLKVGKMDVLDTDPIAKADARVIETTISLDEAAAVQGLTNLQVDVEILL